MKQHRWAPFGLLLSASIWGILWLPMRTLARAGLPAEVSVLVIYLLVIAVFALLRPRTLQEWRAAPATLLPIGLLAGWSNVGFILGVVQGEVMRVTLLFYLAPLWSAVLARLVLGERLTRAGYGVMAVAVAGMLLVLWRPAAGWPLPQSAADWLGLSAGASFAMGNVLARRAQAQGVAARALAIAIGMVLVSLAVFLLHPLEPLPATLGFWWTWGGLFLLLAALAILSSLGIQFGLQHTPATRASVILLFELVVAALSAALLAGEHMQRREWLGGALIVAAGWRSSRLAAPPVASAPGQP